jgi:NAD(P)-dependent dehydrogenase (short-subunit alcohol dehydrogenase family)
MANRLKGKNAVVTGAGSGIGKAVALGLAAEGANIVVCDLGGGVDGKGSGTTLADETVAECKKLGVHAVPQYGSVADFKAAEAMIKACVENFGRIDILVNVAGIDRARMIWNLSEEDWDVVIAVHLKGTFNTIRHAAPLMREQKYGRIVNTISEAFVGTVGHVNYGAAKGGIASLTYAVAWELGRYGVTCNAICPRAATRMTMGPDVLAGYKKRVESGLWTKEKYDEVTHVATADYLSRFTWPAIRPPRSMAAYLGRRGRSSRTGRHPGKPPYTTGTGTSTARGPGKKSRRACQRFSRDTLTRPHPKRRKRRRNKLLRRQSISNTQKDQPWLVLFSGYA